MAWVRPDGEFPRVWHRFQAKDSNSENLVNYVVQDMPKDRHKEAVQFMFANFIPDEPLCSSTELLDDPVSCQEIADLWEKKLGTNMSLVCFKEGSDEIVGMNVLAIANADKDEVVTNGKCWAIVYGCFHYVNHQFDVFEHYNVDKYMTALGLSVSKNYRRRGIATEILKARVPLGRAFGIKVTSTVFTAIGSQMSAAKAGFVENYSIDYLDLPAVNEKFYFPKSKTKSIKSMALEIS